MDKKFTMHIDVDQFLPATDEEKAYDVHYTLQQQR